MEIISNNDLEKYMLDSDAHNMTVKDMHLGIRDMSEAMMYITEFIHTFFMSISDDDDDERPALSIDSVLFAKEMFENAAKFCDSINIDAFCDDDDDDDEEEEDDD
jgi:hypothetical protein